MTFQRSSFPKKTLQESYDYLTYVGKLCEQNARRNPYYSFYERIEQLHLATKMFRKRSRLIQGLADVDGGQS